MNRDERYFEKKLQKFSVVKQCPRCKQLSLVFKNDSICCKNCGYEQDLPSIK